MRSDQHIVLESDSREVPDLRAARTIHTRMRLTNTLRRQTLELSLFDYYYLGVRSPRPLGRLSEYVLDLRILHPSFRITKHIAWRWMTATIVQVFLFGASVWCVSTFPSWRQRGGMWVCGVLLGSTVISTLVCLYRTSETLAVQSIYGRATLLKFTGGLFAFRALRRFKTKLAAHLRIAATARRRSKAEHLRDEMREHFRLKEAGVLSQREYEASKLRILREHGRLS